MQKLDEPRKVQVTVTLDINLVEIVDNVRGRKSRSAWINDTITYMLTADTVPYSEEEIERMYQEHIANLHKINKARKGQYPQEE